MTTTFLDLPDELHVKIFAEAVKQDHGFVRKIPLICKQTNGIFNKHKDDLLGIVKQAEEEQSRIEDLFFKAKLDGFKVTSLHDVDVDLTVRVFQKPAPTPHKQNNFLILPLLNAAKIDHRRQIRLGGYGLRVPVVHHGDFGKVCIDDAPISSRKLRSDQVVIVCVSSSDELDERQKYLNSNNIKSVLAVLVPGGELTRRSPYPIVDMRVTTVEEMAAKFEEIICKVACLSPMQLAVAPAPRRS
ncbi:MAG: hypothetical protein K0S08_1085 [Gammaproteobacteria bacterium]|jgi:hypothetical protein|nr:hypothetical protein [Gammaproteobacteria bacterium]